MIKCAHNFLIGALVFFFTMVISLGVGAATLPLDFNGCTSAGSGPVCTPEFAHSNLNVNYSIDTGANLGTLSFSSTSGYSVTLADDQVADGTSGAGDSDGKSGYAVSGITFFPAFQNIGTNFNIDIIFDLSFIAGSRGGFVTETDSLIDLGGIVLQNTGGSFTPSGDTSVAPVTAVQRNSSGDVVASASLIGDLLTAAIYEFAYAGYSTGDSAVKFSFLATVDPANSLISVATGNTDAQGIAPVVISAADLVGNESKDWWEFNWDSSSASANIVIPLPSAGWLFISALVGLSWQRRRA